MKIKNIFSSPKKIIITSLVILIAFGVLGTVSVFSVYAIAESASVGKETAVSNAYAAAGISSDKVDAVEAKFKFDRGKFVYDIEFYSEGKEYEYKVHSKDGAIIEFEHPKHHHLPPNTIGIEEAKKSALDHAGLSEENVTFKKAKLSRDDGVYVYELEFTTSEKKYEYDISATDGTVIKTEIDPIFFNTSQPNVENLIPIEKAKENALSHAGLTEAVFTSAKLSKDDGDYFYNIHFTFETKEYKYKVDALSGEIIKSSQNDINSPSTITISIEEAKEIALAHSKLSAESVRFIKSELDEEDGVYVYEIEFSFNNKKYEYEVNAQTSEIIKSLIIDKPSPQSLLGIDKAKETVLSHSKINASEVSWIKAELDKEDNIYVYELEFKTKTAIYEYEIDAVSGKVISNSKEEIYVSDNQQSEITLENAKDIAFKDAGITAPQHPPIIKKDTNDGKTHFEIEFSTEKGKFKYEVNSQTGEITEKDFSPINKPSPSDKLIGVDAAKEKALDKFAIPKDNVTFTKAKLENEGSAEYEIEFIHNGKKHEISVDAITGEIHEFEIE